MHQDAGCKDGGAAYAPAAMHAHALSGAEPVGEAGDESTEVRDVGGDLGVGDWVVEERQPDFFSDVALFREAQQLGFLRFEHRDQVLYAGLLDALHCLVKFVAAGRAQHDGQPHGRIALDPEDFIHFAFTPAYEAKPACFPHSSCSLNTMPSACALTPSATLR